MISLILSGGIGSRLWPLSREKMPKQFSDLFEESLFTSTVKRLRPLGAVQVCTSVALQGLTEKTIREENFSIDRLIYEPQGRNTAPAIAVACYGLMLNGQESEVMGIFPSDHRVDLPEVFYQAVRLGESCAKKGEIVTLGIKPSYPATGFGYIDC
ncbi:MAG: sugar phosphate nucleotidyltransferase [Pseudomonadota bacterium]